MKRIILSAIGMLALAYSTSSQAQVITLLITDAFVDTQTGDTYEAGTISCPTGDLVDIEATIMLTKGLNFAQGKTGPVPCNGDVQNWAVLNSTLVGELTPGSTANVSATWHERVTDTKSANPAKAVKKVREGTAPVF